MWAAGRSGGRAADGGADGRGEAVRGDGCRMSGRQWTERGTGDRQDEATVAAAAVLCVVLWEFVGVQSAGRLTCVYLSSACGASARSCRSYSTQTSPRSSVFRPTAADVCVLPEPPCVMCGLTCPEAQSAQCVPCASPRRCMADPLPAAVSVPSLETSRDSSRLSPPPSCCDPSCCRYVCNPCPRASSATEAALTLDRVIIMLV